MPTPLIHDDPVALGPYRLIARLGSGGMGTVYVARSSGGRTVALKTMHAAIATDPAARTRFRLEADAARVIGDRFGARVVDADALAETPWLATEYVLGPPLDEAVEAAGPLPEQSVRALGAALCSALGQLHRSDVVHRDLKPSNILVTAYGPKVIDFGIARAIGDDRLTRAGAAVGTPAFMSPEQATGQEHDAGGDVFALAGVLVYAATGTARSGTGRRRICCTGCDTRRRTSAAFRPPSRRCWPNVWPRSRGPDPPRLTLRRNSTTARVSLPTTFRTSCSQTSDGGRPTSGGWCHSGCPRRWPVRRSWRAPRRPVVAGRVAGSSPSAAHSPSERRRAEARGGGRSAPQHGAAVARERRAAPTGRRTLSRCGRTRSTSWSRLSWARSSPRRSAE
ncbi:serine/threonine-protein kinase [Streptomyces diastatochromogenes]|nr:serine/threonine-protein kinase [Streptomyces diastatochromogenes]